MCLLGGIEYLAHEGEIFTVDDGIDGEVALYSTQAALLGYVFEVIDGEGLG